MKNILKYIGPGIVVAATGIGAGDMIAATVGGSLYGYAILWAVVLGAILKYVLNEGIGRWQLQTGMSVPEAWITKMPAVFPWYFIIYLVLWAFVVGAALIAACGMAAHSIWPILTVNQWGAVHSVAAVVIVLLGNYSFFEKLMKVLIVLLFLLIITSLIFVHPSLSGIVSGIFIPKLPEGSAPYMMAVIGGVGGSVTLLSYGYWIAERNWKGKGQIKRIRFDLIIAYTLTAVFGIAIVVIASSMKPDVVKSSKIVVALASEIENSVGKTAGMFFLVGFWGAVFSSMLGVWQGIPYLFADFLITWKKKDNTTKTLAKTWYYKVFLAFIAFSPMAILIFKKPVWLIMVYSVTGAMFMPFLAVSLLWLNNKKQWIGKNKNNILTNVLLIVVLVLFCYLAVYEVVRRFL